MVVLGPVRLTLREKKKQTANKMKNRRLRVAETQKGWIALLLSLDVRASLPPRSPAWSFFHSWGF